MENPYLELTEEFNRGRLRAVLSSGQAVVLYRLAIMSKDGDWILRPDEEALRHILRVLASRDLMRLADEHPEKLAEAVARRPLLARIPEGREALEQALDEERRRLMRANEERLLRYQAAAEAWAAAWPRVQRQIAGRPLLEAHEIMTARALDLLPFTPSEEDHP